jgi:hypothetical protein
MVTPSLPQRERQPKGCGPPDPRAKLRVETTYLPSEAPMKQPSDPRRDGLAHIEYFVK